MTTVILPFTDAGMIRLVPSLSVTSAIDLAALNRRILSGDQPLDILCVEGSVINGPDGSGRFDMLPDGPRKDFLYALAQRAQVVLAVGTCASFGGIGADSETLAGGLQFNKWEMGGLLGQTFLRKFKSWSIDNGKAELVLE